MSCAAHSMMWRSGGKTARIQSSVQYSPGASSNEFDPASRTSVHPAIPSRSVTTCDCPRLDCRLLAQPIIAPNVITDRHGRPALRDDLRVTHPLGSHPWLREGGGRPARPTPASPRVFGPVAAAAVAAGWGIPLRSERTAESTGAAAGNGSSVLRPVAVAGTP